MDKKALIYMCNDNKLKHYMKDIEKYCLDNQYYLDEKNIFIANKENLKSNLYPGNTLILGELCMLGEKVDEIKQELYLLKNNNINVVILNISNLLNRYLNNKNELNFDKIDLFVELIYLDIQTRVANNKRGRPKINLPSNFNKIYDEWKAGKITAVKAMDLLNLSKTTFYKFVKKYEESIFKDSLEFKSNTTNIPKKNKFSYPNNAIITHFSIYLRDKFGNKLINELVLKPGTKITVLNINFENQLVLIEYLFNNKVKRGFIQNDFRIIKYINENNYRNDYKPMLVYKNELDEDTAYGKLFPYEKFTILYKKDSKFYIVYNTKKGKNSKSGFVNITYNKEKFSYPNNAIIKNFNVYLRTETGKRTYNKPMLAIGTKITVLNINFENQLVLIEYLYNNKIKIGYIKNSYRTIKYLNENNYKNTNKLTDVYEINFDIKRKTGKILPNERATILYENNFGTYIVYNTKKGKNSKSGYLL